MNAGRRRCISTIGGLGGITGTSFFFRRYAGNAVRDFPFSVGPSAFLHLYPRAGLPEFRHAREVFFAPESFSKNGFRIEREFRFVVHRSSVALALRTGYGPIFVAKTIFTPNAWPRFREHDDSVTAATSAGLMFAAVVVFVRRHVR